MQRARARYDRGLAPNTTPAGATRLRRRWGGGGSVFCAATAAAAADGAPLLPRPQEALSPEEAAARDAWRQKMRGRMLGFMGPALIMPLGEPLMNVVDTVCLGQWAGTAELAAMGPACIIFAFAQYIFQALQISTVTLISGDLRNDERPAAQRTLACALSIAVAAGLVVAVLLEIFAEALIAATGADPALAAPACAYIRIRALAQPAVLATMVLQAALVAQQDSVTPAVTTSLAVTVSLVGNLVAVGGLGLGIIGAAGTTVATQLVGAAALIWFSSTKEGRLRPALIVPKWADLVGFATTMGPLAVAYVCKNTCYLVLQTAAAGLDTVRLAAHQAVFSYWNLLAFTTAPLEQISLAFVPASKPGWQRRSTAAVVLALGAAIGIISGLLSAAVPAFAPQLLTRDAAVWGHMASVAPLALGAMVLTAADVAATGVLLANRDLRYVAQAFLVTLAGLAAFMAAQPHPRTLEMIWHGCVFFFGARLLQSGTRLAWLWRTGGLDCRPIGEEPYSGGSGGDSSASGDASTSVSASQEEDGEVEGKQQRQQRQKEKAAGEAGFSGNGAGSGGGGGSGSGSSKQQQRQHKGAQKWGAAAGGPDPAGGQLELSP